MKFRMLMSALLVGILCICNSTLAATYSGGSGTAADPYRIANKTDLLTLAATAVDYSKCFILAVDIDLAGENFAAAVIAPDTNSAKNAFQGTMFTGIFDGKDRKISNLTIIGNGKQYVGLFGYVGSGGQIKNLGVANANIKGAYYVGGLVGYNHGTITSCNATGTVSGTEYVGGLVGYHWYSTISSCYTTNSVTGTSSIGGLVGCSYQGTITSCNAMGAVSGTEYVGGLIGYNYYQSSIVSSFSSGTVDGKNYVGGLVGYWFHGSIIAGYATGSVTGTSGIGGLVGYSDWSTNSSCYATGSVTGVSSVGGLVGYSNCGTNSSCYATGSVTGVFSVGGLVGNNFWCTITSCYSTGLVSGTEYTSVGGLVGYNHGTIYTCFWDIQTSGTTISDGGEGKTTVQVQTLATFTDAGWGFSDSDGDAADWMMLRESEDYPRLAWQDVFAGDIAGLYGVDFVDYAEIAAHWGQIGCPTDCESADINNDGAVDIADLMFLVDKWLEGNVFFRRL